GRFATWPAAAAANSSAFNVCVLGSDSFGATLEATVKGETIDGRDVVVTRTVAGHVVTGCRILFIGASESIRLKEILASVAKSNVLTVSDLPHFTESGGMIQFVLEGSKVRFRVN